MLVRARLLVAVVMLGAWSGAMPGRAVAAEPGPGSASSGRELVWLVQGAPAAAGPPGAVAALAAHLERLMDARVELRVERSRHPLEHWNRARSAQGYHIALDDVHYAAYRARRSGFRIVLTAGPGRSYRVITRHGSPLVEREDLRGVRIAAQPPPALAALRLLALFSDRELAPEVVPAAGDADAVVLLRSGRARAALLERERTDPPGFTTMLVLDEVPAPVVSLSPALPPATGRAFVEALQTAWSTPLGRDLLDAAGLADLRPVEPGAFQDYDRLLRGTWGYAPP